MDFAKIWAEQALGSAFKFRVLKKLKYMCNYLYFELVRHTDFENQQLATLAWMPKNQTGKQSSSLLLKFFSFSTKQK